ncbi:hypothetical protein A2997_02305 [Candidatus Nomurabacteria bacterium RIFCSPLOWO2_01_FULL_36_10b]|uniref:Uncharacterized protein n=1 Tax=Candidatus Nomurabacteria bacterium RIFCSPLOWO2_01_FULL_36_10b TaxID=1801766 RepID=A0A1F6WN58_9BACT|nr:MAG: hypothetical protein A2997_02305 [Candidatus Nomurabacteria bacterium RIFCSPLOWO2_01_FULL_36_10b]
MKSQENEPHSEVGHNIKVDNGISEEIVSSHVGLENLQYDFNRAIEELTSGRQLLKEGKFNVEDGIELYNHVIKKFISSWFRAKLIDPNDAPVTKDQLSIFFKLAIDELQDMSDKQGAYQMYSQN